MTLCRVCGRAFDPNGFQVVVPGLGQGFDRVECAEIALARGVAPAAPPAAPLPAVVKPFPAPALGAAAAPVATVLDRRPFLLGANVALLAAGTAVTVPASSAPIPPRRFHFRRRAGRPHGRGPPCRPRSTRRPRGPPARSAKPFPRAGRRVR